MSKQIVYVLAESNDNKQWFTVGVAMTSDDAEEWSKANNSVIRHFAGVPILNSDKSTLKWDRFKPDSPDEINWKDQPKKMIDCLSGDLGPAGDHDQIINHWDPLVSAIKDLNFRLEQIMESGIKLDLDLDQRTLAKIAKALK